MNIGQIGKAFGGYIDRHSGTILCGAACVGVVATAVLASNGAIKAVERLKKDNRYDILKDKIKERDTAFCFEVAKDVMPYFIPCFCFGTVTICCMVGSSYINTKRSAAIASAYILSSKTLESYKKKTEELLGKTKADKISSEIKSEELKSNPVKIENVVDTRLGETLCFDRDSGRYFYSDIEKIKQSENEINKVLLEEGWVSLNDIYDRLMLPPIMLGEDLGVDYHQNGLLSIAYDAELTGEGVPCMTIDMPVTPKYCHYYG